VIQATSSREDGHGHEVPCRRTTPDDFRPRRSIHASLLSGRTWGRADFQSRQLTKVICVGVGARETGKQARCNMDRVGTATT